MQLRFWWPKLAERVRWIGHWRHISSRQRGVVDGRGRGETVSLHSHESSVDIDHSLVCSSYVGAIVICIGHRAERRRKY